MRQNGVGSEHVSGIFDGKLLNDRIFCGGDGIELFGLRPFERYGRFGRNLVVRIVVLVEETAPLTDSREREF